MTTDEYKTTMERLGCRSAREAADLIGCCERMARYYAKGNPVPLVVAKRLRGEIELRRLRNVVEQKRELLDRLSMLEDERDAFAKALLAVDKF